MSCTNVVQGQLTAKRKKKFTGGNASKRHRDRVNVEFNNLAKLLPYPEAMISKLDKSSILRLAVSYIRAKSFFKDNVSSEGEDIPAIEPAMKKRKKVDIPRPNPQMSDNGYSMAEIFLQALEGFLLVITEDLKVLYVSESVRDYLGYCQAGIIHESILNFVHGSDEGIIRHALQILEPKRRDSKGSTDSVAASDDKQQVCSDAEDDVATNASSDSSSLSGMDDSESNESSLVQSRKFVCRMKCAFSCSSRFFTAFNSFQFSGHLRKSYVQEGKVKKSLNTLIVFCSPMDGGSKYDGIDVIDPNLSQAGCDEKSQWPTSDDEMHDGMKPKLTGLPIEPKFRLHVAPIVMSSRDLEHCTSHKTRHVGSSMKARRNISSNPPSLTLAAPRDDYDDHKTPLRAAPSSKGGWYRADTALDSVEDARYPFHRVPRVMSSNDDHHIHAANAVRRHSNDSGVPHKMSINGHMGARDFPPEVFSSAKILLDLSQHCVARKEYDNAVSSARANGMYHHAVVKTERWHDDMDRMPHHRHRDHRRDTCSDDALLETHNRIYHIPRDRCHQQFPYANGGGGGHNGCCIKCEPDTRHSPCHAKSTSPPAIKRTEPKRGFNISSILGLDENRNGSRENGISQDLRCPNGNILHFPKRKETLSSAAPVIPKKEEKRTPNSMEDMKSSFADILQGMASNIADRFNSAITKAIEKTNDRQSVSPDIVD